MTDTNACPDVDREARLGRIAFRAWRRGFREADLVLGPFSEQVGPTLDDAELAVFVAMLMEDDDHALYAWIIETAPTPERYEGSVMTKIRAFMAEHVSAAVAEGAG